MMREHQVHSAAVYVKLLPEILLAHHGALQMPAREAFAPWRRPFHQMFRSRLLPQREIVCGVFVVLPVEAARSLKSVVERTSGEDAVAVVVVVFDDVEINGTVALIGISRIENFLHKFFLLNDVS